MLSEMFQVQLPVLWLFDTIELYPDIAQRVSVMHRTGKTNALEALGFSPDFTWDLCCPLILLCSFNFQWCRFIYPHCDLFGSVTSKW